MNAISVAPTQAARSATNAEAGWTTQRSAFTSARVSTSLDPSPGFAAAWDDLAANAAEPNAFAERWFVEPSLAHLPPPEGTRFVTIWCGDRLDGLLALQPARGYARLPVPYATNWMHYHCFLGVPLVRHGQEERVWGLVIALIDSERWAGDLLHLSGLTEDGPVTAALFAAAAAANRPCDIVHRSVRALLESDLAPQAYIEHTIRKKKRKEYNRLANRLREEGEVVFRTLDDAADLDAWCDAFLALEASGWKGEAGSSLGSQSHTTAFFRAIAHGAFAAGKLEMLQLEFSGKPIAMLVNFLTPPGSFSFKIAFDEDHARFSPGVMIQLENFRILARENIAWMDSCAVENHPMINGLWGERRGIVRVTLPRAGLRSALVFRICRMLERASDARRQRLVPAPDTEAE
jgi:CelD/BcsL family acetyltransferase involved in cellulose biosynthesis